MILYARKLVRAHSRVNIDSVAPRQDGTNPGLIRFFNKKDCISIKVFIGAVR